MPASRFASVRPGTALIPLWSPSEVLHKCNFLLALGVAESPFEYVGSAQEFGETWRLLSRHQELIDNLDLRIVSQRLLQKLHARMSLVPSMEAQTWKDRCGGKSHISIRSIASPCPDILFYVLERRRLDIPSC